MRKIKCYSCNIHAYVNDCNSNDPITLWTLNSITHNFLDTLLPVNIIVTVKNWKIKQSIGNRYIYSFTQAFQWRIQAFPDWKVGWGATYHLANFSENCMKMTEFGPRGEFYVLLMTSYIKRVGTSTTH